MSGSITGSAHEQIIDPLGDRGRLTLTRAISSSWSQASPSLAPRLRAYPNEVNSEPCPRQQKIHLGSIDCLCAHGERRGSDASWLKQVEIVSDGLLWPLSFFGFPWDSVVNFYGRAFG
jgi:hypothetical protein